MISVLARFEIQKGKELEAVAAVTKLRAWLQRGAHRIETAAGSKVYQDADAIRIFDAWWPLLVSAQFEAPLGDDLYQALVNTLQINESPSGGQHGRASDLQLRRPLDPQAAFGDHRHDVGDAGHLRELQGGVIWSAGCANGQEAWSLAIRVDKLHQTFPVLVCRRKSKFTSG